MPVRMTHPEGGAITAADDKVRYYEAAGWVVTTEPTAPKRAARSK